MRYSRTDKAFGLAFLLYVAVVVAGCVGWVLNIVKIVAHVHDPLNTLMVLRLVGTVVAPLGAILGYIS